MYINGTHMCMYTYVYIYIILYYIIFSHTHTLFSLVALKAFHHEAPFSPYHDTGVSYRVPRSPGDLDRIKKRIALRVALSVYAEVECGVWQTRRPCWTWGDKVSNLGTCWTTLELELNTVSHCDETNVQERERESAFSIILEFRAPNFCRLFCFFHRTPAVSITMFPDIADWLHECRFRNIPQDVWVSIETCGPNLSLGFFRSTVSKEDINLDKKVERDMIDRDMCGSFFAHLGNCFWIWLLGGPHPKFKSCSHHFAVHVDLSFSWTVVCNTQSLPSQRPRRSFTPGRVPYTWCQQDLHRGCG